MGRNTMSVFPTICHVERFQPFYSLSAEGVASKFSFCNLKITLHHYQAMCLS